MSERPSILFGLLLATAAIITSLLLAGLAGLGSGGIIAVSATLLGAFSACAFFIAELRDVPFASIALIAATLGSIVGLARAVNRYRREQRIVRALPLERISSGPLAITAEQAGTDYLYLARANRPAAFCVGLVHPRVVVTSGLLSRLAPNEQAAVVWHEAQHARMREPLRSLICELAVSTFFWIPALRDLRVRYLLARELDADRAATSHTSRRALAGALHEVMLEPALSSTVGIGDVSAARIDRLFDPTAQLPRLFKPAHLTLSIVALVGLTALLASPASLSLNEHGQLDSMLTTASLHGLPGMAAGFTFNTAFITGLGLGLRHILRRRHQLG